MSDSESDIEIRSALPKMKMQRPPKSPSEDIKTKKITTKVMIVDALTELKTRKGVSLYAIKKHLKEKYEVNTDQVNYLIKKTIKAGVEDGTFVQMKGIGAAGSFKLANKEKPKPKKIPAKPKEKTEKTKEKATMGPVLEKKMKKLEKKTGTKADDKQTKEARKPKKMDIKKTVQIDEKKEIKVKKAKKASEKEEKQETEEKKKKKVKIAKGIPTPSKKRSTMMKRKSIGSIIKPPKMKPKKA